MVSSEICLLLLDVYNLPSALCKTSGVPIILSCSGAMINPQHADLTLSRQHGNVLNMSVLSCSWRSTAQMERGNRRSVSDTTQTDVSYIELNDPQQGDEQEVEGDEEAEGPPHVGDALLLPGFVRPRTDGRCVDIPHPPGGQPRISAAAASAVHRRPRPPGRAGPPPHSPVNAQKLHLDSEEAGHRSRKPLQR